MVMLTITLDPTNPIESHVIQTNLSPEEVKTMFMLGYAIYSAHADTIDDIVKGAICSNTYQEIIRRHDLRVSEMQNENVELVRLMEQRQEELMRRHDAEIAYRDTRVRHLEQIVADSEAKLNKLYDEVYKEGLQHLRDQVKEKDMQIHLLRSSNAVKGLIGENKIMNALRNLYVDADIQYMGRTAHACDIKMVMSHHQQQECTMLFESKYKGSIDKCDIQKFVSDIEAAGPDVKGGMFISILSKNIPGKGNMCIDIIECGENRVERPVMYVGYDSEQEFDVLFAHHVRVFQQICGVVVAKSMNNQDQHQHARHLLKRVLDEIKFFNDMIKRNQKRVDDMRQSFKRYCSEMEDTNTQMMTKIGTMLSEFGHPITCNLTTPTHCMKCNKSFKTERGYLNHKCNQTSKNCSASHHDEGYKA